MTTDAKIADLHAFAAKIGVKRCYYDGKSIMPHYDLTIAERAKAVTAGAVEVSWRDQAKRRRADRAKP